MKQYEKYVCKVKVTMLSPSNYLIYHWTDIQFEKGLEGQLFEQFTQKRMYLGDQKNHNTTIQIRHQGRLPPQSLFNIYSEYALVHLSDSFDSLFTNMTTIFTVQNDETKIQEASQLYHVQRIQNYAIFTISHFFDTHFAISSIVTLFEAKS